MTLEPFSSERRFGNDGIQSAYEDLDRAMGSTYADRPDDRLEVIEEIVAALVGSGLLTEKSAHRAIDHPFYNQEEAGVVEFIIRAYCAHLDQELEDLRKRRASGNKLAEPDSETMDAGTVSFDETLMAYVHLWRRQVGVPREIPSEFAAWADGQILGGYEEPYKALRAYVQLARSQPGSDPLLEIFLDWSRQFLGHGQHHSLLKRIGLSSEIPVEFVTLSTGKTLMLKDG